MSSFNGPDDTLGGAGDDTLTYNRNILDGGAGVDVASLNSSQEPRSLLILATIIRSMVTSPKSLMLRLCGVPINPIT